MSVDNPLTPSSSPPAPVGECEGFYIMISKVFQKINKITRGYYSPSSILEESMHCILKQWIEIKKREKERERKGRIER